MPITKTGKKKDGLMQYRVRINYTDSTGKAHQVERTAYGSEEAKQLEKELMAEYKDKRSSAKLTVLELYNEYIEYHSHETRRTSHDSTVRNLRLRVLPYLADYQLTKLSQPVLAKWKNEIAAADYALVTKQNAYAAFVAMLNYAVKMDYLPKNPLTVLGNFRNAEIIEKLPTSCVSTRPNNSSRTSLLRTIQPFPALTGDIMCSLILRSIQAHAKAKSTL